MLLVLAAMAAVPTTRTDRIAAPTCERPHARTAATVRDVPRIQHLDRMPPAKQILGVLHEEDGCTRPIVIRDQVGAPSRP